LIRNSSCITGMVNIFYSGIAAHDAGLWKDDYPKDMTYLKLRR
jgi:hypothetical protein